MAANDEDYVAWKGWAADQFGKFTNRDRRYFDWHIRRASRGTSVSSVLEIGFGNGAFLGYCKFRGWQATGIEIESQLRQRAERAGFATASALDELPADKRFDLIVLFDVLEHVAADGLLVFVKSLRDRLNPEGAILLRVPNGDSPFGRIYQHGDLTHVTAFSQFKLDQLARICGLRLAAKGEAPWYAQQYEARTPRALLRGATRHALSRLLNFAYYGWKVDLSLNLAAVLRHGRSK